MKKSVLIAFSIIIVALALTDANFYLQHFGFRHTDGDQTIYWNQCKDIAQGEIHSLFLYGQDYNIPLESWLSAPLVNIGFPLNKAMPLVGMFMMMLSFMLLAYQCYLKESYLSALLALGFTLLLPVEWQLMTTMPRGFFSGIFVATLSIVIYGRSMSSQLLSFLLAALAFFISANSVLLPGAYYTIRFFKREIRWKALLIALAAAVLLYINIHIYRENNAAGIIHRQWDLSWTWNYFSSFFSNFNQHFKGTAPVFYTAGGISILILIAQLVHSLKDPDKSNSLSILVFLVLLLFSFGVNKVHDGTGSAFFPLSRMYLALPLVIIVFSSGLEPFFNNERTSYVLLIFFILLSAGLKFAFAFERLNQLFKGSGDVVKVYNTAILKKQCNEMEELLKLHGCKAYVLFEKDDGINYGSMALNGILSYHPRYERRIWVKNKVEALAINQILFWDAEGNMLRKFGEYPWERVANTNFPLYRLKWNSSMKQLGLSNNFAP